MSRADYDVSLLIDILRDFRRRYPHLKVILEPGSAFAWQTGPLVSQVVDIVEDHGIRTAILNVSFTCHMPDCLEMPYMPAVRGAEVVNEADIARSVDAGTHVYRLGGNSCLSGVYLKKPKPNVPSSRPIVVPTWIRSKQTGMLSMIRYRNSSTSLTAVIILCKE